MSKRILLYIVVTTMLLLPSNIEAQCSNTEKVNMASLAQNVTITYDYVEANNTFSIVFTNLQPGFKLKDVANRIEYLYSSSELVLYGYKPGTSYRFDIYGTGNCTNRLYTHYVTIPGYNPYYNDPICVGVNHSICQKWTSISYDYNTFIREVNNIKQKLNKEETLQDEEKVLGVYDYITAFFINYYYIILPIIIITCVIIIVVKRKKDDLF